MAKIRAGIRIGGVVQGVGFRPFLHRQMLLHGLAGWIRNSTGGVEMEAEGEEAQISAFLHAVKTQAPDLASVESVQLRKYSQLLDYAGIEIRESSSRQRRTALISPDAAVCRDCLREMMDPGDRRWRYPFINCTNCGPRFTIIRDVPYDRKRTTMASFAMCPECAAEYGDIADRRYHAQPDCCPMCGPRLFFLDAGGREIDGDPVALAAERIARGEIIAVKGLGGMHLACRCDDASLVAELRKRKHRDEKPMALMCRDLDAVRRICRLSPEEEAVLTGPAHPILLLEKRDAQGWMHLSENRYLGVMLPYTPVHHLLMASGPEALVMTSANVSDLPIVHDHAAALSLLRGIADGFLLNNRDIENRCDDSLMWVFRGREYPVRRSRGYAPYPLRMEGGRGRILACGAEQKAGFCLSRGEQAFMGPHIGDLKNAETLEYYEKQIALHERLFDVKPELLACDLHPDYLSTDYARARARQEDIALVQIQHHHAHMAACMADNELEGDCIGIVWDGTGLGTDGSIWGGEFLVGGYGGFRRAGSLNPFALPGGDRAVKEIWRIAAALLLDAGENPEDFLPERNIAGIRMMIGAGLNCPQTSSMGRLFDGVCALLGIRDAVSYEGQGAILLEAAAEQDCTGDYGCSWIQRDDVLCLDVRPLIRSLCQDVRAGVPAGRSAAQFMNTMVRMAREMCVRLRGETGLNHVVLSGGVFQNMYMLGRLMDGLEGDGFEAYCHSRVPANDAGISFGQLAIVERGGGNHVSCGTAEGD